MELVLRDSGPRAARNISASAAAWEQSREAELWSGGRRFRVSETGTAGSDRRATAVGCLRWDWPGRKRLLDLFRIGLVAPL